MVFWGLLHLSPHSCHRIRVTAIGSTPREIVPLVVAFNSALDRLEAGMRAQRDFSSNAAHELRTPLASLRAQVESLQPAACAQRPIVMTTVAMIAGMAPIALGYGADASFRQPMALAVIGGLLTSTALSLLVVPLVFTLVDDLERRVRRA
jgi:signal transduction histidine kinase